MADIGAHKRREDRVKEQRHFVRIFISHGKQDYRIIVQLQIDAQHGGAGDQLVFTEAALAPAFHEAAAEGEHGGAEIPGDLVPVLQVPYDGADGFRQLVRVKGLEQIVFGAAPHGRAHIVKGIVSRED